MSGTFARAIHFAVSGLDENGSKTVTRVHLATAILALALGACGYNNNYNNQAAYNDSAGYVANATNYSEDANYTADDANYSANAAVNESVDVNATDDNVSNVARNY